MIPVRVLFQIPKLTQNSDPARSICGIGGVSSPNVPGAAYTLDPARVAGTVVTAQHMSIPETQLETWCNQGATVTSAAAYTSIKTALADPKSKVRDLTPEIYLQGSYGNSTNIYADSDVDVVVQYNSVYGWDVSGLPQSQQLLFAAVPKVNYSWRQFYPLVLESLGLYFGNASVHPGNKAIKVKLPSGRTADVVAVQQHRKFASFLTPQVESHIEGIQFEDKSGRVIINYPKEHLKNGEAKNSPSRTNYRYKQTVRMFKNARNAAIDRRLIAADLAPSYFLECLIYNVPDNLFGSGRQETFAAVVDYVRTKLPVAAAMCQNGQIRLFGNAPEQWDVAKADALFNALISLWNNW